MQAPDFALMGGDGKLHTLSDYKGRWLVLYFYPKDETAGCTKEACNFRDEHEVIAQTGNADVVGVSTNSVESHRAFAQNHHLTFTLLSDPDHVTIEAYGAWGLLGTKRNTYIISPEGRIVESFEGVDPESHVADVVGALKELQGRHKLV